MSQNLAPFVWLPKGIHTITQKLIHFKAFLPKLFPKNLTATFCSSTPRLYGNETRLLSSGFHRKVYIDARVRSFISLGSLLQWNQRGSFCLFWTLPRSKRYFSSLGLNLTLAFLPYLHEIRLAFNHKPQKPKI